MPRLPTPADPPTSENSSDQTSQLPPPSLSDKKDQGSKDQVAYEEQKEEQKIEWVDQQKPDLDIDIISSKALEVCDQLLQCAHEIVIEKASQNLENPDIVYDLMRQHENRVIQLVLLFLEQDTLADLHVKTKTLNQSILDFYRSKKANNEPLVPSFAQKIHQKKHEQMLKKQEEINALSKSKPSMMDSLFGIGKMAGAVESDIRKYRIESKYVKMIPTVQFDQNDAEAFVKTTTEYVLNCAQKKLSALGDVSSAAVKWAWDQAPQKILSSPQSVSTLGFQNKNVMLENKYGILPKYSYQDWLGLWGQKNHKKPKM